MLAHYGYIDRRNQSALKPEDRLSPLSGSVSAEQSCQGCACTTCPCTRRSTATSRHPETLRQARTFEEVRARYVGDGFCAACSVQAAFGHQMGFSQVTAACVECQEKRPTYRFAAEDAHRWAGTTLNPSTRRSRLLEAA